MSPHDDCLRVRHMLDHSVEAVEMARGRSRKDLDGDRQFNLSLVRLLEIVGEATAAISREFRENHPEIPWRDIIGLRNRLIHGYDAVDFDILWTIVQQDLPVLISQLETILQEGETSEDA